MEVKKMSMPREAYQELTNIVGPEYITEEPAVLDGYCFIWGNEVIFGDKFSTRPLAVIMPGSVEEVQAIVKVCNKHRIRYKAHASGWETVALTAREPFLPMDLRRMNRILEIDEKNKYAVVEPYVSTRELMIETFSKGLRCHFAGCGPSASAIASSAGHFGSGASNISTDYGGRTPLGVEWVLPDGEILRLGSLGTGAGWFSGDGPGPSLRGVMRGYGGANGAMGVMTKVAIKLYPWYGPDWVEAKGSPPGYEIVVPKNFKTYTIGFPSRESQGEFLNVLMEEAVAHAAQRGSAGFHFNMIYDSMDELAMYMQSTPPEELQKLWFCSSVVLDASSSREMHYREKCLEKLLEKTGGYIYPFPDKGLGAVFHNCITGQGGNRAFRASGSFVISPVGEESWDTMQLMGKRAAEELHAKYEQAGQIVTQGEGGPWGVCYGDTCGHLEQIVTFDPADPNACKAVGELVEQCDKKVAEWRIGINLLEGALSFEEASINAAAPYCLDFPSLMRKIKKAFDPNLVAESSFYVTPKE